MRPRHLARVTALQTLFEVDLVGHAPEKVLAYLTEEDGLSEAVVAFARKLVQGVLDHRSALDAIIAQIAPNWPVEQLPGVDRNVLRMAIYEILSDNETPVKVIINEAVELAKTFGSESSRRFVNGVLGTVAAQSADLTAKYFQHETASTARS